MSTILDIIQSRGLIDAEQEDLDKQKQERSHIGEEGVRVYCRSLYRQGKMLSCIASDQEGKFFYAVSKVNESSSLPGGLLGEELKQNDLIAVKAPFIWENYLVLKELFPFTAPISLRTTKTTIGCGDRLGNATPGHLQAITPYDASPVCAQQSVRELTMTNRNYRQVVTDAAFHVFQEGFERGYGADGDHLKTIEDIDVALEAGMPMITLDLTEVMEPGYQNDSQAKVDQTFESLPSEMKRIVMETYAGKSFAIGSTTLTIPETEAKRCALMYWKALDFAEAVDRHLREKRGDAYDLEISIDETTAPTLPEHHLFIARELARRDISVNSIAPRFIGEFQKGIDYIGDIDEFEKQFRIHAEIAQANGNYKISVHSGSDKFSVYPAIGKHTGGRLHLKTAGTSWLEAVKTIAMTDPGLYRVMHAKAFEYFPQAAKQYHVTTDLDAIPDIRDTNDEALTELFKDNNVRQLLHITYGFLLNDLEIREHFFTTLDRQEEAHYRNVSEHIANHIELLGVPRRRGEK
jgi:hypothetical protein